MPKEKIIAHKDVGKFTLYGNDAIRAVEAKEGKLTPAQKRVIVLEGYVPVKYYDSKGVVTSGVGQTGEFIKKGFKESFKTHEKRAKSKIKGFDNLPDTMKAEFIQADYRGDLGQSPTAVKLFNQGKFKEAAKEFLNNAEYKGYTDAGTGGNIPARMEAVSREMERMGGTVTAAKPARKPEPPETILGKYTPPVKENDGLRRPDTVFSDLMSRVTG